MTPEIKKRLKDFYSQLADRPLEPDDPFYEPGLSNLHDDGDAVAALATRISFSDAESVNLLSGQRGCGKSTELRRLRKLLKDEGCVVLLCDMRDYMNLTSPVEVTDFLISIMGALNESLVEENYPDVTDETYWARLVKFLQTDVKLGDLKFEVPIGPGKMGISASLKEDLTFKARLQQQLRGHVARLVQQAHDFARDVVEGIRKQNDDYTKKVVLLIDSVEQLRGVGAEADTVYKSVENLFSGHASALHLPLMHVVYTIPPYLTPLAPGLARTLGGGTICNLPSVRVRKRNGDVDQTGISALERVMARRHENWAQVFNPEHLRRMALGTGGDLRDFFRLAKDCLVKAAASAQDLPVAEKYLVDAENHLRRDMLPIAKEDAVWLANIARSKKPELDSVQRLPALARFFDTHLVLNYRNGDDWYDVHPLLKSEIEGK